ncbi:MAG: site-2 protease family protein [Pseudomonadota bacterium]
MIVLRTVLSYLYRLARLPLDLAFAGRSASYTERVFVRVPRDLVFKVLKAPRLEMDGIIPLTIEQVARADAPDIFDVTVTGGDTFARMVVRESEVRPNEVIVTQVIKEGTDPRLYYGDNYYVITRLSDGDGGTWLEVTYQLDHGRAMGRVEVPAAMISATARIRDYAERQYLGEEAVARKAPAPVWNALVTGAITLLSFGILFGFEFAALLIGVLLLHELGHVFAMRWCGMPVRGIYFIPFMGAVAVGTQGFGTEGRRGFIALMGPAASVLSTAVFVAISASQPDNDTWRNLALISIFLNAFNLLPFLPLDGGQIVGALLSRAGDEARRFVQFAFILVAAALSVYIQSYIMLALFTIVGLSLISRPKSSSVLPEISWSELIWLAIGFAATFAFYVAIFIGNADLFRPS